MSELPAYVEALDGRLTLWADFDHPHPRGIVLYLVNRTGQRLAFSADGGDPYIMLEAEAGERGFVRAQTHYFSTCGNSYFYHPMLSPGEFFRILGYQPADGKPGTIRYRMFNESAFVVTNDRGFTMSAFFSRGDEKRTPIQVVSNSGPGRASESDMRVARYDSMAPSFGPFEDVLLMAKGRAPSGKGTPSLRIGAITGLGRFPTEESANALASMLADEDVDEVVVHTLAKLGDRCERAEEIYQSLLKSEHVRLRALAIASLGLRAVSDETVAYGIERLKEDRAEIRIAAISLLAQIAGQFPAARQAIEGCANDPDDRVRLLVSDIRTSWKMAEDQKRRQEERERSQLDFFP